MSNNPFDPNYSRGLFDLLTSPSLRSSSAASELLGFSQPRPHAGLGGAASDLGLLGGLFGLTEQSRRRSDWNARFEHWEKSESDAETIRIERARGMVYDALTASVWLRNEGAVIVAQGSFTNRTNARLEADIDLRVQHPLLKIECAAGVNVNHAWTAGGYWDTGRSFATINSTMRDVLVSELSDAFGAQYIDANGNKAIRVNGLSGSRSEVDVVATFTLHYITSGNALNGFVKQDGVSILARDNSVWTANFPEQHAANGKIKRLTTGLQFKRVVRIVKRLRSEMKERGIGAADVPSFLIECLVYLVEDNYFTVESDDRYGRIHRVMSRLSERLSASLEPYLYTEINGVKPLFTGGQPWTLETARRFVTAALIELG